jgi:hypothetical protein
MARRARSDNPLDTKRRNRLRARGIIVRCKRGGILTKVLSNRGRAQFASKSGRAKLTPRSLPAKFSQAMTAFSAPRRPGAHG